jgi:hypothetical protein
LSERDSCLLPNSPHIPKDREILETSIHSPGHHHRVHIAPSFAGDPVRLPIDKATSLTAATCWTSVVLQGRLPTPLHPQYYGVIRVILVAPDHTKVGITSLPACWDTLRAGTPCVLGHPACSDTLRARTPCVLGHPACSDTLRARTPCVLGREHHSRILTLFPFNV